jgi:hypothetical protein
MFSAVDISPGYGTEADVVCFSYEENVEDISVPGSDVLSSPSCEEEVVADTDQEHPILMNIPAKTMKRRTFPWVLFMMIMTLTLGRAMKKKRSNRRGSLSLVQNLSVSNHHLGSVSLH